MDGHCSAQGRVLSPLLFNLLVNSLAADIRRCCPGVRLVPASDVRFVCHLYADDVAILTEAAEELQRGLDAVTSWGRKWRFTFGVSPEKSAVMIFGTIETNAFLLGHFEQPRASRCPCLSQLGRHFGAFALVVCAHQPSRHSRPQVVCTEYNRHLLRWPDGTPNASVLSELSLFDSLRMAHGQALSLYGRLTTLDSGTRAPLPAVVFRLAASVPGTWAHWCRSLLVSHSCWVPELSGVGPGSNPGAVRRWFVRGVALALDRAWSHRLIGGLSALHSVRFDVSSSCFSLNHAIYGPWYQSCRCSVVGSCQAWS